jgi:hypothetical protein
MDRNETPKVVRGAPASLAPLFMLSARALEVVAGLGLAFGIYLRPAAVALLAFLIPTTLLAHAFWQVAGQFDRFTANMGGLLFIGAQPSPGRGEGGNGCVDTVTPEGPSSDSVSNSVCPNHSFERLGASLVWFAPELRHRHYACISSKVRRWCGAPR